MVNRYSLSNPSPVTQGETIKVGDRKLDEEGVDGYDDTQSSMRII